MFTVVFAVGRSIGWISQWCEMASESVARISRPRQMYEGEMERRFVPLEERGGVDVDAADEDLSGLGDHGGWDGEEVGGGSVNAIGGRLLTVRVSHAGHT